MSKLKSKARRASHLTSSVCYLRANSWRMAALSSTIMSTKGPPALGASSKGQHHWAHPAPARPEVQLRQDDLATGVTPTCIPVLSTTARSVATPAT